MATKAKAGKKSALEGMARMMRHSILQKMGKKVCPECMDALAGKPMKKKKTKR